MSHAVNYLVLCESARLLTSEEHDKGMDAGVRYLAQWQQGMRVFLRPGG